MPPNSADRRRRILKKAGFTEQDEQAVAQAIVKAEQNTSGEIVAAITPASHTYSFWELLCALVFSAAVFAIFIFFSKTVTATFERLLWTTLSVRFVSAFSALLIFVCTALFFLCANIPAVDRMIVPARYRKEAVYRRALRFFAESGVYETKDHSGVLIFISLLEREACIIADRGVHAKVAQQQWNNLASQLAAGFGKRKNKKNAAHGGVQLPSGGVQTKLVAQKPDFTHASPETYIPSAAAKALIQTIENCGDLLASHFPAPDNNIDELNNSLVVLEAGE